MYLKKKEKFVLFGSGRNGSNLLKNLLKSHPDIFCDEELLNLRFLSKYPQLVSKQCMKHPQAFIRYRMLKNPHKIYGFKLMSGQHDAMPSIVSKLHEAGWKFIFLTRKNKIKQAFSWAIAAQTDQWVRWKFREPPNAKYRVDPGHLVRELDGQMRRDRMETQWIQNIPHLKIVYEDDLFDREKWGTTMERVFKFLNTYFVHADANNRIVDPRPDQVKIINFDEIISSLKAQGYENLVDEYYTLSDPESVSGTITEPLR